MAIVLVTGMSGTGKSTVLSELARRGMRVVDTDSDDWSRWDVDPEDGSADWVWREDRIAQLLANHSVGPLYLAGCKSNQGKFYDRFDAVVLLSAPIEVILERIAIRDNNDFGKRPEERLKILRDLDVVEPVLRATCTRELDATNSIDLLADALVVIGTG